MKKPIKKVQAKAPPLKEKVTRKYPPKKPVKGLISKAMVGVEDGGDDGDSNAFSSSN